MKAILMLIVLSATSVSGFHLGYLYDWLESLAGYLLGLPKEPEFGMTVPEIIAYHGYPGEIHHVTTEDGYILTLHRIPNANNGSDPKPKPPALLQHGLMCASDVWVWNTPDKNLAYILADKGFDVWLGNFRGNQYSSNHTTLRPNSKEFWDFSWDEMAKYDLPAMIDYVLNKTGQPKLWYIGQSMGTAVAFAMLSTKTEYNDKVKNFTALAPVVTVGHMKSPIRYAAVASNPIGAILSATENGRLNLDSKLTDALLNVACGLVPAGSAVCSSVAFALFGPDFEQLNQSRVDYFLTVYPASTSVRTLVQFAQNVQSKKFNYYDFGPEQNLIKYNQTTPPEYNITKITAAVALLYGRNDWLAPPEDVEQIPPKLQNLVFYFEVLDKLFSHQDFLWAKDVKKLVYNYLTEAYEKYQ